MKEKRKITEQKPPNEGISSDKRKGGGEGRGNMLIENIEGESGRVAHELLAHKKRKRERKEEGRGI